MSEDLSSAPELLIRDATAADAAAVAGVYNHYVLHTVVTFEEEPVSEGEMRARIGGVQSAGYPWLVAEEDGVVFGYAYGGPWKARSAYRFAAEVTVYLAPGRGGKGVGGRLYERLFGRLREKGLHALMGGIALPNEGSVALHEKMGMKKVAHFEQTGFKQDRWIDVGYWQLLL